MEDSGRAVDRVNGVVRNAAVEEIVRRSTQHVGASVLVPAHERVVVFARENARRLGVLLHGIALQRNVDEVVTDGEHQLRLGMRGMQVDYRGG